MYHRKHCDDHKAERFVKREHEAIRTTNLTSAGNDQIYLQENHRSMRIDYHQRSSYSCSIQKSLVFRTNGTPRGIVVVLVIRVFGFLVILQKKRKRMSFWTETLGDTTPRSTNLPVFCDSASGVSLISFASLHPAVAAASPTLYATNER
jgi:hypothetical protein